MLNLVAVEEGVRLDAVVRLLDTSVGVVNRSDTNLLRLADLQARTDAVFEVEGRTKVLVTCRCTREDRKADASLNEWLHVTAAEFINKDRGEGQRMRTTRSIACFPVGVTCIPVAS